jgi:hypothetical protein
MNYKFKVGDLVKSSAYGPGYDSLGLVIDRMAIPRILDYRGGANEVYVLLLPDGTQIDVDVELLTKVNK